MNIEEIDLDGPWTPKEAHLLHLLSLKIARKNGWVPDEALRSHHQAVNHLACELVIQRGDGTEILLARYNGKGIPEYHGLWHIPGGYTKPDEDLKQTCSRVGRAELNARIEMIAVMDIWKWPGGMHPWGGRPLSCFVSCELLPPFSETESVKFWHKNNLPCEILSFHSDWIKTRRS